MSKGSLKIQSQQKTQKVAFSPKDKKTNALTQNTSKSVFDQSR